MPHESIHLVKKILCFIAVYLTFLSFQALRTDASTFEPVPPQSNSSTSSFIQSELDFSDLEQISYSVSNPSKLNFPSLVKELGLTKTFSLRFQTLNTTTLPPWCTKLKRRSVEGGLFYNRMPKASSSTTAGIVRRISDRVAKRFHATTRCNSFEQHTVNLGDAQTRFGGLTKNQSFLFSTIRDPAKRAISRAFYDLSNYNGRKGNPHTCLADNRAKTEMEVLRKLKSSQHQYGAVSPGLGGFQIAYLGLNFERNDTWLHPAVWDEKQPTEVLRSDIVHKTVKGILEDYDFFILVERYDESFVVMQLLLGLTTGDILYVSSTNAAGSYNFFERKICTYLQKPFLTDKVGEYITSDEWYAKQYGDYLLMEAVNQSLDLTIDALGRERFSQAFKKFQFHKKQANAECADSTFFPCSKKGIPQIEKSKESCYTSDWGCGYKCLDEYIDQKDKWVHE